MEKKAQEKVTSDVDDGNKLFIYGVLRAMNTRVKGYK
jgi:hypothetical protein